MKERKAASANIGVAHDRKLRILYLEDEPPHFELASFELKRSGYKFEMRRVETREEFISALEKFNPDIILADYYLPKFSAPEAFTLVKEMKLDMPFIIVSGALGEELAVETLKSGITDYVLKNNMSKLGLAVKRALIEVEERNQRLRYENELQMSVKKLRVTLEQAIHALAAAMEIRDPYTAGHQRQVAILCEVIAIEMGLDHFRQEAVYLAGLVHDIGKIAIPAEILAKPTRLNEWEMNLVKTHPHMGYQILKDIEFPWPIAKIVLQHHERLDGSGYPAGLKGEEIEIEARIMAVADVVEAMHAHRPYRPSQGINTALEEINAKRNILYDPQVAEACTKVFHEKNFKFQDAIR